MDGARGIGGFKGGLVGLLGEDGTSPKTLYKNHPQSLHGKSLKYDHERKAAVKVTNQVVVAANLLHVKFQAFLGKNRCLICLASKVEICLASKVWNREVLENVLQGTMVLKKGNPVVSEKVMLQSLKRGCQIAGYACELALLTDLSNRLKKEAAEPV